jgi:hypothetical protein
MLSGQLTNRVDARTLLDQQIVRRNEVLKASHKTLDLLEEHTVRDTFADTRSDLACGDETTPRARAAGAARCSASRYPLSIDADR